MNLRILKKLSRRAHALMVENGTVLRSPYSCFPYSPKSYFPASKWDNFTNIVGHDRKHWERGNARYPCNFEGYVYWAARSGKGNPYMHEPSHPLKGTMMRGWTVGYEEPEWEEATCWELFSEFVRGHYQDYVEIPGTEDEFGLHDMQLVISRQFKNPSQVFRAYAEGLPK